MVAIGQSPPPRIRPHDISSRTGWKAAETGGRRDACRAESEGAQVDKAAPAPHEKRLANQARQYLCEL